MMIQRNRRSVLFAATVLLAAWSGCVKMPEPNADTDPDPGTAETKFDFATTKTYPIRADYRQNGYSFLVEVYTQNPVKQVNTVDVAVKGDNSYSYTSEIKDNDIEPIFRAITDHNGSFSDVLDIPSGLKKIYLYTEYAGLPTVVAADVTANGIRFDLNATTAATGKATVPTRAATHKYPDGMLTLGDWNAVGVPDYLLPERAVHPSGLMNDLNSAIPYTSSDKESPLWKYLDKSGCQTNIELKRQTPVRLVFADENASMMNAIGYYHYPTNDPPSSAAQIKTIIAFPNFSFPDPVRTDIGGMSSGDQVQLKYWNSSRGEFEDEFPANTTIGFVVLSNSFKNKDASISVFNAFYSNNEFNTTETVGYSQHCIVLNDAKRDLVIYGFEDVPRQNSLTEKYPGGNFRDAFFYVKTDVPGAIDTDNMTELPEASSDTPSEADNFITYKGSLSFEDLWPYEGDYDMNDVVMDYACTVFRNKYNQVIRCEDRFTARHNGGKIATGFGYQIKANRAQIKSVVIAPAPSSSSLFKTDSKGLETNQSLPTIMLFDDIRNAEGQTYTITTEFLYPQNTANLLPPYNPFVVIHTDLGRGKELHLPNQQPTDLADATLFGQGHDRSSIEKGIYYVSKDGRYPFAIKIPGVSFKFPDERVRIDEQYPLFRKWVESAGTAYQNWYESGINIEHSKRQ